MRKQLAILTTTIALLGAAFSVSAAVCPANDIATGTSCNTGQTFCGGNCVSVEPSCSPSGTASCTVPQKALNCSSCSWQCSGGQTDCSATNGNCQSSNGACATTFQQSVCNASAGATTQSCGACLGGYLDCDATAAYNCKSQTNPACIAPKVWDPCASTCNDPAYLSPSSAQTGAITITGGLTSTTGNLSLTGITAGQGDIYMVNGKAIRMDDATRATQLNVGNWGAGVLSDFSFSINDLANSNTQTETLSLRRTRTDATAPGANFGSRIGFHMEGFTDGSDVTALTVGGGWEAAQANDTTSRDSYLQFSTMLDNLLVERMRITSAGLVGIGTSGLGAAAPGFQLDVRSQLGNSATDTAVINVANENASRIYTGYRIARGNPSTEKWFLGMNATDDAFRIRRGSTFDDVTVDTSGNLSLYNAAALRFSNTGTGTYFVGFKPPAALGASVTWTLPATDGTSGQVLTTNGTGALSWSSAANACSGRQFVGMTASSFDGNLDSTSPSSPALAATGYVAADALCAVAYAGSKVCTTDEILNSIKCTANGSAALIAAFGNSGWINGGPPGYSASTNDCAGWTSDSSASTTKGRIWSFAATTGGAGWLSFCDAPNKRQFSCCK